MTDRIRTLLVDRNYVGGVPIALDTLLQGVLGIRRPPALPGFLGRSARLRWFMRALAGERYDALSYMMDWRDAFMASPRLDVDHVNMNDQIAWRRRVKRLAEYDLVVLLHSAAGDAMDLLRHNAHRLAGRRGKLVVFVGNEYRLMPGKIAFLREAGADYVASQLPRAAAEWLYAEAPATKVLLAPHALNPTHYRPLPGVRRSVDIGFRGAVYPTYIGDVERTRLFDFFRERGAAVGLSVDIQFKKVVRDEWNALLNAWKGIVGAESGTYFLERTDDTQRAVEGFLRKNPRASFDEVYERFFRDHPRPMSGKAISSRHFEPMGTRTCQVLLEGDYNGLLRADVHYVAVAKDLSNIDDAVRRFKDDPYRTSIADAAYEYAMAEHTYARRVGKLLAEIAG